MLKTPKRLLSASIAALFLITAMLFVLPGVSAEAASWTDEGNYADRFAEGTGEESDPYLISTPKELALLSKESGTYSTKYFKLKNDIDLTKFDENGERVQWSPIMFSGTFDGAGYTVSGVYIHLASSYHETSKQGLFGDNNGTIKNLGVDGDITSSGNDIGGVCGENNGTIQNCRFSGTVTAYKIDGASSGGESVGGVCGNNFGTIQNCHNAGNVSGNGNVGGVCGNKSSGSIKNCYNTGTVSGSYRAGGVCGINNNGDSINNCYNTGTVSGSRSVGGVCGENYTEISNCYNTGTVSGGGVCGTVFSFGDDINITNCYNTGNAAKSLFGGITMLGGTLTTTNCYYLDTCSPDYKGIALTEAQFKDKANFTGWDFDTVWTIDNILGRPVFTGVSEPYFSGSGTEADPYLISDLTKLEMLQNYVEAGLGGGEYFKQTADIDMSEKYSESKSVFWTPIGNATNKFTGTYDGNGHTISGIITDESKNSQGLFGCSAGTIMNVSIVDSTIKGYENVGGICGLNEGAITNCYFSGSVDGSSDVGGVCGDNQGTMTYCYNTGSVKGSFNVGGVCGNGFSDNRSNNVSITNCYNTGSVSGTDEVGGVCGTLNITSGSGIVKYCYNTGSVIGSNYVGGVCGNAFSSYYSSNNVSITNCYNTGSVSGKDEVGGVCGTLNITSGSGIVKNCYNIGSVSGVTYPGGICGRYYDNGDISNCYYNKDICTYGGVKNSDTETVRGLSTPEMTCGEALSKMTGFDTYVWGKKPNDKTSGTAYYPYLKVFGEESSPSVGYKTKLYLALSDENAEYSYGDTIKFDVSALVKFDGMADYSPDSSETPFARGKGTFTVNLGDDMVVPKTDIYDNTLVAVTSSEINKAGDAVAFTLYYNGAESDYFPDSDISASCNVKIRLSLTAADFNFTAPTELVYDGKAKSAEVTANSGITGIGTITVNYYDTAGSKLDSAPVVPGTYTVKADVTEGDKYLSAADLTSETWTFTIDKAVPTVSVTPNPASDIGGKTITVTAQAKNPHNSALTDVPTPTLTYKVGESGTETAFTGSFVIPEGTPIGTIITITAATAENANYLSGTGTTTVTVTDCQHTDKTTVWEKDSTGHWHICNYCGAAVDKAEHIEDSGTVTTEPTYTTEGIKTYKCVCEYVMRTETIPALTPEHTHEYDTEWKSDNTHHWHECSCGDKTNAEPHTEDGGTVTKEPTETEKGETTYKCTVCGRVMRTESIDSNEPIPSFVERLYTKVLNRPSEADGKADWVNQLNSGVSATEVSIGFIFSEEFANRNLSNEEIVTIMYSTFFDRAPDEGGFNDWVKKLNDGCSLELIFHGFTQSVEFNNLCDRYGIERGTYETTQARDKSPNLTAFVSRMYTKALGRQYEVDGLNTWTDRVLSGDFTLDAMAHGFIFSDELNKKELSDEEFVDTLYATFFDRAPDAEGRANWLGRLESGEYTRVNVLDGFLGAQEFANLVKSFEL